MISCTKKLLITLLLTSLLATQAAVGNIKDLIGRKSRPRVAEIKRAMGVEQVTKDPFTGFAYDVDTLLRDINYQGLARSIVAFEKAFPGATLAFLGRDSAHAGDIFDAFYESIDQPGRVVLLGASGGGVRVDDSNLLFNFLKSNGLDADHIMETPGYIILDTTGYSANSSQSWYLMRAAYSHLVKMGHRPEDLIHKVNFVNIGQNFPKSGEVGAAQYFNKVRATENGPNGIMTIGVGAQIFTYGLEWHNIFGPIKRHSNGRYLADPGQANTTQHQPILQGIILPAMAVVSSPQFLKLVQEEARHAGFEFPLKRFIPKEHPFTQFLEREGSLLRALERLKEDGKLDELSKETWKVSGFDKEILELTPTLIQKGFTLVDLRDICQSFSVSDDTYVKILRESLPLVRSLPDYLLLVKPLAAGLPKEHRAVLDGFILEHFDLFKGLGATAKDLKLLEKRSIKLRKNKIELWKKGLELVHTPKDYLDLTEYAKADMGEKYERALAAVITESVEVFLGTKPGADDVLTLLKRNGKWLTDETKMGLITAVARNDEEFLAILGATGGIGEKELKTPTSMNANKQGSNIDFIKKLEKHFDMRNEGIAHKVWSLARLESNKDLEKLFKVGDDQRVNNNLVSFVNANWEKLSSVLKNVPQVVRFEAVSNPSGAKRNNDLDSKIFIRAIELGAPPKTLLALSDEGMVLNLDVQQVQKLVQYLAQQADISFLKEIFKHKRWEGQSLALFCETAAPMFKTVEQLLTVMQDETRGASYHPVQLSWAINKEQSRRESLQTGQGITFERRCGNLMRFLKNTRL